MLASLFLLTKFGTSISVKKVKTSIKTVGTKTLPNVIVTEKPCFGKFYKRKLLVVKVDRKGNNVLMLLLK